MTIRPKTALVVSALAGLLVVPAAAQEAGDSKCPFKTVTGEEIGPELTTKEQEVLAAALLADLGPFAAIYLRGVKGPLRDGNPEVTSAEVTACVTEVLARPDGAQHYYFKLRQHAADLAVEATGAGLEWFDANPGSRPMEAVYRGCLAAGPIAGEAIGALFRDFADQTFSTEPDPDWKNRPRSPRLWPAAALRDALIEGFYFTPRLVELLQAPPLPEWLQYELPELRGQMLVPYPSNPIYARYHGWIDPSGWPGDKKGDPNPMVGASLLCMDTTQMFLQLKRA